MKKNFLKGAVVCLLFAALTGCMEDKKETMPATTAEETTQVTTEAPAVETTEPEPLPLVMEQPAVEQSTTWEETLTFQGSADPRYPLEINGVSVQPNEDGSFTYEAPLEAGENRITVRYLEETLEYTAIRRYTTAWYSYEEDTAVCSGASVYAEIFARQGSSVTVSFSGKEQTVSPSINQLGSGAPEGFAFYTCRFDTPGYGAEPTQMGPITYTVTCDGITEVYVSGNITCQAAVEMKRSDPEATPQTGDYRDVGSGYIVEIVDVNAETFNGKNLDDKSIPTMSYLPKGTVDYGSQGVYYNESANRYYYLLRCGVRVYRLNDNSPVGMQQVVDCYNGYLPDHNEISVASIHVEGHHTYLTLDCLWKAPFFFDEEAQEYRTENWQRFILDEYDADYVDITFCYATQFTGSIEIPEDNPLFSSAELIRNEADYTLRLHLKEHNGFYGWDAYYNEDDQLCFKFLNPVTVTQADNAYGADLTGIKVMIDVGHGGMDPGACYPDSMGRYWEEAERNLFLAKLVKAELESIGATVVMNRTDEESTVTRTERVSYLLEQAPDFCICIHHNADLYSGLTGFESWYFTNFSNRAANHISSTNIQTGIYYNTDVDWHYYFVARQTVCPVVLTENGFMSNKWELDRIANEENMRIKAAAITQGIVNYFLENSGVAVTYQEETTE